MELPENTQSIVTDPIQLLIKFFVKELYNEIIMNKDQARFWKTASDTLFSYSLSSFREGLIQFQKTIHENKDMYNYFACLCFRTFSQPFTKPALKSFTEGFKEIATDPLLGTGIPFEDKKLGSVESLMLFYTVHNDEVTLMLYEKATAEKNDSKGRK